MTLILGETREIDPFDLLLDYYTATLLDPLYDNGLVYLYIRQTKIVSLGYRRRI